MPNTIEIKKKIKKYLKLGYHKDVVAAYRRYKKGDMKAKQFLVDHYAKKGKTIIWENSNFSHYLESIQKGKR
jgi:hypothetical protein